MASSMTRRALSTAHAAKSSASAASASAQPASLVAALASSSRVRLLTLALMSSLLAAASALICAHLLRPPRAASTARSCASLAAWSSSTWAWSIRCLSCSRDSVAAACTAVLVAATRCWSSSTRALKSMPAPPWIALTHIPHPPRPWSVELLSSSPLGLVLSGRLGRGSVADARVPMSTHLHLRAGSIECRQDLVDLPLQLLTRACERLLLLAPHLSRGSTDLGKVFGNCVPVPPELPDPGLGLLARAPGSGSRRGPHLQPLEVGIPIVELRLDGAHERPGVASELCGEQVLGDIELDLQLPDPVLDRVVRLADGGATLRLLPPRRGHSSLLRGSRERTEACRTPLPSRCHPSRRCCHSGACPVCQRVATACSRVSTV